MAQNSVNGFIVNAGQLKDTDGLIRIDLLYTAQAAGAKIYLRQNGISFCWYQQTADSLKKDSAYRVDLEFVNPNSNLIVYPSNKLNSYSNYFIGNVAASNVSEYRKITYQNLWPNIDLEICLDSGRFIYKYKLKLGANPNDIKISYNGVKTFQTNSKSLDITLPFNKSISFQNPTIKSLGKTKYKPSVAINLNSSKTSSLAITNFNTNTEYEVTQEVSRFACPGFNGGCGGITTPGLRNNWTTYYGGSGEDEINDTFIDLFGNIYMVGTSSSADFPRYLALNQTISGSSDIVVAKFRPDRSQVFSTYYGGTKRDWGRSIVVNSLDEIYFAGATQSMDYYNINTTGLAFVSNGNLPNSGIDGCITKLNPDGTQPLWSTYYSNTNQLVNIALAIGPNDKLCMTGCFENQSNTLLPLINSTTGYNQGFSPINSNAIPGFIARFNTNDDLEWSSYFSGRYSMWLTSCAVDQDNNFYILGHTSGKGEKSCKPLTNGNVPICGNGVGYYQDTIAGSSISNNSDLIIAKFNNASELVWSTFYGGSEAEGTFSYKGGNSIATDANGDIFITGVTRSRDFPGPSLYSAAQRNFGGGWSDAFVVRFNSNGERKFASYIGGSDWDYGNAISPYIGYGYVVGGETVSTDFPLQEKIDNYFDDVMIGSEGFINLYNPNNDNLEFSTYVGGNRNDKVNALGGNTATGSEHLIVAGNTESSDFDVRDLIGTIDYFEPNLTGGNDGFLMDITFCITGCREAILSNENTKSKLIYPNPSSNFISISPDQNIERLEILSLEGKQIFSIVFDNSSYREIDISNMSNGMYLIKLINSQEVNTFKFIKQ